MDRINSCFLVGAISPQSSPGSQIFLLPSWKPSHERSLWVKEGPDGIPSQDYVEKSFCKSKKLVELLWDLLDTGAFCFFTFLVCDTTPDKEQLKGEKVHFSSQFKGVQSIMEVKAQGREEEGWKEAQGVAGCSVCNLHTGVGGVGGVGGGWWEAGPATKPHHLFCLMVDFCLFVGHKLCFLNQCSFSGLLRVLLVSVMWSLCSPTQSLGYTLALLDLCIWAIPCVVCLLFARLPRVLEKHLAWKAGHSTAKQPWMCPHTNSSPAKPGLLPWFFFFFN